MDHEVDAVARAFYDVSGYALPWDEASPVVREQMRKDARTAICSLDEYQGVNLVDDFLCRSSSEPSGVPSAANPLTPDHFLGTSHPINPGAPAPVPWSRSGGALILGRGYARQHFRT